MSKNETQEREETGKRLGMTFHETFPLVLPAVCQVLRVAVEKRGLANQEATLSRAFVEDLTTLGPNYVRSMPRYAVGAGLLDYRYRPTSFGRYAFRNDPTLSNLGTLWLMHYHLSAPIGHGPAFWGHLITSILRPGDELRTADVAATLGRWIVKNENKIISEKTLQKTASVFLGTYSRVDSLGPLGVLRQLKAGRYLVTETQDPPVWVFGYALANFWRGNWSNLTTVSISKTSDAGGPGTFLLMGSGQVNKALGVLQTEGFVTVQRRMPPFQVYKQWKSPEQFLERLYA